MANNTFIATLKSGANSIGFRAWGDETTSQYTVTDNAGTIVSSGPLITATQTDREMRHLVVNGLPAGDVTVSITDITSIDFMDLIFDWNHPAKYINDKVASLRITEGESVKGINIGYGVLTSVTAEVDLPELKRLTLKGIITTVTLLNCPKLENYDFLTCTRFITIGDVDVDRKTPTMRFRGEHGTRTRTVTMGNVPNISNWSNMFEDMPQLTSVVIGGMSSNVTDVNADSMFNNCPMLTEIPASLDQAFLDKVINNKKMFANTGITTLPAMTLPNLLNSTSMFEGCTDLTSVGDLTFASNISTKYMFRGCTALTTVGLVDLPVATSIAGLFSGCTAMTTAPAMTVPNLKSMNYAFSSCSLLTVVPLYVLPALTDMSGTFSGCSSLVTLPAIDTSTVEYFDSTFFACTSLVTTPTLDLSGALSVDGMFQQCTGLTSALDYNTSSCKSFNYMFKSCGALLEGPALDTTEAHTLVGTWKYCYAMTSQKALILPKAFALDNTWEDCESLTNIAVGDYSGVRRLHQTWKGCINIGIFPALDFHDVIEMNHAFHNCIGLAGIGVLSYPSLVTCIGAWKYCTSLVSLPNMNFPELVTMQYAFRDCTGLTGGASWTTPNLVDLTGTFMGCTGLITPIPISTAKMSFLVSTWEGCTAMTTAISSDMPEILTIARAWYGCTSLVSYPTVDMTNLETADRAWEGCTGLLTHGTTLFPNLRTGRSTWQGCSSLGSHAQLTVSEHTTNLERAWFGCTSMVDAHPPLGLSTTTDVGCSFAWTWALAENIQSVSAGHLGRYPCLIGSFHGCTNMEHCNLDLSLYPVLPDALQQTYAAGMNYYATMTNTFRLCMSIHEFPPIDLTGAESLLWTFKDTAHGVVIPAYDFTTVTQAEQAFYNCGAFEIPAFTNTQVLANVASMFAECKYLYKAADMVLPAVEYPSWMFMNCGSLTRCPRLEFANCGYLKEVFKGCKGTITASEIVAPNVTLAEEVWEGGRCITGWDGWGMSAAVNLTNTFRGCHSLEQFHPDMAMPQTSVGLLTDTGITDYPTTLNGSTTMVSATSCFSDCKWLDSSSTLTLPNLVNANSLFSGVNTLNSLGNVVLAEATNISSLFKGAKVAGLGTLTVPKATLAVGMLGDVSSGGVWDGFNAPLITSYNELFKRFRHRGDQNVALVRNLTVNSNTNIAVVAGEYGYEQHPTQAELQVHKDAGTNWSDTTSLDPIPWKMWGVVHTYMDTPGKFLHDWSGPGTDDFEFHAEAGKTLYVQTGTRANDATYGKNMAEIHWSGTPLVSGGSIIITANVIEKSGVEQYFRVANCAKVSRTTNNTMWGSDPLNNGESCIIDTTIYGKFADQSSLFAGCENLVMARFDTPLGDCTSMFEGCAKLAEIHSAIYVDNGTQMFKDCPSLLVLGGNNIWTDVRVNDGTRMFEGCVNLATIDVGVYGGNATEMFKGCTSLTEMPFWMAMTDCTSAFEGCTSMITSGNGLFTKATTVDNMFKDCTALTHIFSLNFEYVTSHTDWVTGCTALIKPDATQRTALEAGGEHTAVR